MSASTEKKERQAARAAGTDKKTLAAQSAAEQKKKSSLRWTLGTIAVVLLIAAILFLDSGYLYTHTTALTIGDEKYSPADVSYRYAEQYFGMVNQYGSYVSVFGLDTSAGIAGLDKQDSGMGGTWKEYFLDAAKHNMIQIKALKDYAAANNITLSEEDTAEIEESIADLEELATQQGYASASNLLSANYGSGVSVKTMRKASQDSALASAAYNSYRDGLVYTDEELEETYQGFNGDHDFFDFAVYNVSAEVAEGAEAPTEEALAEAHAKAEAIVAAYNTVEEPAAEVVEEAAEAVEEPDETAEKAADFLRGFTDAVKGLTKETAEPVEEPVEEPVVDTRTALERFNDAVAAETDGAVSSQRSAVQGSSLDESYHDWLVESGRVEGDVTVVDTENGSTVVFFLSREDNHYHTVNIRHILIRAEASEDGTYTDEALAAAQTRAEEILAEYEAGDKTEESFAALAEAYSTDTGSNTNGGLYENVAKGQMVAEFDAFCFAEHQPGDTGIVYGNNGSYAGYHVIYYVGQGDLYSNTLAETELRSTALSDWVEGLEANYEAVEGSGYRYVGK